MYKEETRKYKEKKIIYKECMLQIETGSISLMVFVVNGVMGLECNTVFSRIAESISMKNDIPKSVVTNFSYTKISYSLFLTMLTCVRGSQSHKSTININIYIYIYIDL